MDKLSTGIFKIVGSEELLLVEQGVVSNGNYGVISDDGWKTCRVRWESNSPFAIRIGDVPDMASADYNVILSHFKDHSMGTIGTLEDRLQQDTVLGRDVLPMTRENWARLIDAMKVIEEYAERGWKLEGDHVEQFHYFADKLAPRPASTQGEVVAEVVENEQRVGGKSLVFYSTAAMLNTPVGAKLYSDLTERAGMTDSYTSEMGAAATKYHERFKHAHPLPVQWRWEELWNVMESARRAVQSHVLYEKGDADAPDCIKDRNGDITLGLCKVCGRGEAELIEPCTPRG